MMKTMEKLMDKLYTDDKSQMKDQNEPQVRNPNFRRKQGPPAPPVMPRGQRNPNEQQIKLPFQENLVDEEFIEKPQDHIHHFGNKPKESKTFVTKEEHDSFLFQQEEEDGQDEAHHFLLLFSPFELVWFGYERAGLSFCFSSFFCCFCAGTLQRRRVFVFTDLAFALWFDIMACEAGIAWE